MRPGHLKRRLILFRIEFAVLRRRQHTEYVLGDHFDDGRVDRLDYGAFRRGDVVDEFVQRGALDFLAFQLSDRVVKIEHVLALDEFFDDKRRLFVGWRV